MQQKKQVQIWWNWAFHSPIQPQKVRCIQAANTRALSGGVTTDKIFDMVRKIRKNTQIPLVFMTYANVGIPYGTDRFLQTAAEIGMDGLILPDVPFEEKAEFDEPCKKYGLDLISLIAPTSHERISMIAREASGFVYCVSSSGGNRRAKRDHHRHRCHGKTGQRSKRHSMCHRIRYLHTRAGGKDGSRVRWSYCGKRDRQTVRTVWRRTAYRM